MMGMPPRGTRGFGITSVKGASRTPLPPAQNYYPHVFYPLS